MKIQILFFCLLLYPESISQEYQEIKSVTINKSTQVSIDRGGNIYFASYNGDIVRLDPKLEDKHTFSPDNPTTTTILEAWQGLRIFTFHRDLQQYRLINRNLSLNEDYGFPPDIIGFAEVATPSYDNKIWLIDQVNFSLIKFDITTNTIISNTPLNQLLHSGDNEIIFLKEYQNRLFLSTQHYGILIFDNLGNYMKTYNYAGISYFNFWKDDLYFINEGDLVQINLYNEETSILKLPNQFKCVFALIFENRLYLFSENKLVLYNR